MKNFGEQFLHQKDPKLQVSQLVEHEFSRKVNIARKQNKKNKEFEENNKLADEEKKERIIVSQKPVDKIEDWLEVIKKTHTSHADDPRVLERIKNYYHRENVIKAEDVPESTFLLEQTIARNQGHGIIEITDKFRKQKTNEIISNQEKSLDKWVDYLSSPDAAYPMWAKYWAFNSMLKMGKIEKMEDKETKVETMQFKKRTKDTTASFPTLNPRALAMTISAISAKAEQNSINKQERITPENISKKLNKAEFKELVNSENFSKIYAQFLIEMPEYSTEGLKETRGQWKTYKKGSEPDELVKSLDGHPLEWCTANIDTARTQLKGGDFHVYYSINENGEAIIPRVAIRMEENNIGEVRGIAANQNMDPYIDDVVKEKMKEFPDGKQYEKKSVDMKRLTEIEEKNNQQETLSKEDLSFLYQIDNKIIGFGYENDPRIKEITSQRNLRADLSLIFNCSEAEISVNKEEALRGNIKYHYGNLDLNNLNSTEGLVLPQTIGGNLDLNNLRSAVGLVLPQTIKGSLGLFGLTSAVGLVLPQTIKGSLILGRLNSTKDLMLPQTVGSLDLKNLSSAKGLILPQVIKSSLDLRSLSSAEGLVLPQTIAGYLDLSNLRSTEGLVLPQTIGDYLYLGYLNSAGGLVLPKTIGGDLDLSRLSSADGLVLPEIIGGTLYLHSLSSTEKDKIKTKYPNIKIE